MKQRTRARSSSLFLLELIIAILFFSIASAVCVKIFAEAHTLNQESQIRTWSANECASISEIICTSKSVDAAYDTICKAYPQVAVSNGIEDGNGGTSGDLMELSEEERLQQLASGQAIGLTIGFDKDFEQAALSEAEYAVYVAIYTDGEGMLESEIIARSYQDNRIYYELDPIHYTGEGGAGNEK